MSNDALVQFVAKLERRAHLLAADREALLELKGIEQRYAGNETLVAEGAPTTHCCFLASGFVSRVKRLPADAQQIVAFHIPGDAVDLQSLLFSVSDHRIYANCETRVFWVPHADILDLSELRPSVAKALWLETLADASIFREWTVNVGRRNAGERIAHLLLELEARFAAIAAVHADTFELPVTQSAMAEALGLSLVHLNKSLQLLRRDGHVHIKGRTVSLSNKGELIRRSGFKPDYLHLNGLTVKPFYVSATPDICTILDQVASLVGR